MPPELHLIKYIHPLEVVQILPLHSGRSGSHPSTPLHPTLPYPTLYCARLCFRPFIHICMYVSFVYVCYYMRSYANVCVCVHMCVW